MSVNAGLGRYRGTLARCFLLCVSFTAGVSVYANCGEEIRDNDDDEGDLLKHVGVGKLVGQEDDGKDGFVQASREHTGNERSFRLY